MAFKPAVLARAFDIFWLR